MNANPMPLSPRQRQSLKELLGDRAYHVAALAARGLCVTDIATETGWPAAAIRNSLRDTLAKLKITQLRELPRCFGHPPREYKNLATLLQLSVQEHGDRPLLGETVATGVRWTSYREFGALVARMRGGLYSRGLRRSDAVVISNDAMASAIAAHACFAANTRYMPIGEAADDAAVRQVLAASEDAWVLVADRCARERVMTLQAGLPGRRAVFTLRTGADDDDSFATLLDSAADATYQPPWSYEDAVCFSVPDSKKLITIVHSEFAGSITASLPALAGGEPPRGLAVLQPSDALSASVLGMAIASGGSIVTCEKPVHFGDYIHEVEPTWLFVGADVLERTVASIVRSIASWPPHQQHVFWAGLVACAKRRRGEPLDAVESSMLVTAERELLQRARGVFGGALRSVLVPRGVPDLVAAFLASLGIDVYVAFGFGPWTRYDRLFLASQLRSLWSGRTSDGNRYPHPDHARRQPASACGVDAAVRRACAW